MRRTLLAFIAALLFAVVLAVRAFDPSTGPVDEILAYEVSSDRGVEVLLHGGVQHVSLTSWLLLPVNTSEHEHTIYSLDIELFDHNGSSLQRRRFDSVARLPGASGDMGSTVATLPDGKALVSDSHTATFDVSQLKGHAGRLKVVARPNTPNQVLLRIAHRVERTQFEQKLIARTLSAVDRSDLTGQRTSLGFFDLPDGTQASALSHWMRRLSATGREGRDYSVRRLLLRPLDAASTEDNWLGQRHFTSAGRPLAINLTRSTTLRVRSDSATRISITTGEAETASYHDVKAGGTVELQLRVEGLTTAVLSANPACLLALSAPIEANSAYVRGESFAVVQGQLDVVPDWRRQATYSLDPTNPVRTSIAPAQHRLGLQLRAQLQSRAPLGDEAPLQEQARVEFLDTEERPLSSLNVDLEFQPARFESIGDREASEPQTVRLHLPSSAASVAIFGPRHLFVVPFVDEPEHEEQVNAAPYNAPLKDGDTVRYAPLNVPRRIHLKPDNELTLRDNDRKKPLLAQVRVERSRHPSKRITPRVLRPLQEKKLRFVFSPTVYGSRYPYPANGWVVLNAQRPSRHIAPPGPESAISLSYRAPATALGNRWKVLRDGLPLLEEPLSLLSSDITLPWPSDGGELRVEGLGVGGVAVVRAKPTAGGRIVQRRRMYALASGESIDFTFTRKPGQLLGVAIGVLTENGNQNVELDHRLDRDSRVRRKLSYQHRPTSWRGAHKLRTGSRGRAMLWTRTVDHSNDPLPDRLGSLYIPLGDDLPTGTHTINLTNTGSDTGSPRNQVWIRAVLVGRAL